ncbi:MAG: acyltransferase [Muribaculaceae bacterium]|nr:acyltransferase [Muribaculaceae bacterium]
MKTGIKSRASNIELLRIISMMMVVIVHLDGGCLSIPNLEGDWGRMDVRAFWRLGVESLAFIGVNCFTLISGYFGIRLRWKSVASYLLQCLFYALGIYAVICTITPTMFSWSGLADNCMVLTHTDLWYVPAYFILMLLSPVINGGFDSMSRRRGMLLTGAFVIFNLWAGWWWGGKFNASGYTAWQLVMMYCIGRVISSYKEDILKISSGWIWMGIYLLCSLATVLLGVYDFRRAYSYNQPFVILASVSFFLFFISLKFRSGIVNYAAKSAFAVYLLHKSPLIWGRYLRPAIVQLWVQTTLAEFSFIIIGITVAIYISAMIIDTIRRYLSGIICRSLK